MRWTERRGIHYLVDGPHNQVVAEVRRAANDLYRGRYGDLPARMYPDLEDARSAMVDEHELALKAPKEGDKKPKKKGKGKDDAAESA